MRCVILGSVAAACLAAGIAYGEEPDQGTPVRDAAPPANFLYLYGADGWRNGLSAHAGVLWSPAGLDQEGFVLKLLAGGGDYRYWSGALGSQVEGIHYLASLTPGWRFKFDKLEIVTFAGLDLQDHQLFPDEPNRLRGFHAGARLGADVWYEPFSQTMVAANISLSTINWGYWTRAAAGWRAFDLLWLGPEALALGDTTYRQFRLGIHATALKMGGFEWSAGLGFATDSDGRNGPYGRIGVLTRR
jgi:hypothetical protein